jgi:hypothetical protein
MINLFTLLDSQLFARELVAFAVRKAIHITFSNNDSGTATNIPLQKCCRTVSRHFRSNPGIPLQHEETEYLRDVSYIRISNPPTDQTAESAGHLSVFQEFLRVWHPTQCSCDDYTNRFVYISQLTDNLKHPYVLRDRVRAVDKESRLPETGCI